MLYRLSVLSNYEIDLDLNKIELLKFEKAIPLLILRWMAC